MHSKAQVEPLLKWAGGKRHIAQTIFSFFPRDWAKGTFYEPFLGGAAVFLYALPGKAHLSDVNAHLVRFYQDVKNSPIELFNEVSKIAVAFNDLPPESREDFYSELRRTYNSEESSIRHSAHLFALNKLCFNGLYRENSRRQFNVPFGKKKVFPSISQTTFESASEALQNATIDVADFETAVERALEGDFVYLDPPYIPLNSTSSFTSYSAGGFGLQDQERLAEVMANLATRGVRALLSNSSTELTRRIFAGLRIETVQAPRMVSAKASGRGSVEEVLIANYDSE